MKPSFRRSLCSILILFIIFTMRLPVSANEPNDIVFDNYEALMDEYIKAQIPAYLAINNLLTDNSQITISQCFEIGNDEYIFDYIYFVFSDNCNIGYIDVYYYENQFHSRFVPLVIFEIDEALANNYPISIIASYEGFVLCSQNRYIQFSGTKECNLSVFGKLTIPDAEAIITTSLLLPANSSRGSTVDLMLNVPIVANDFDPDGEGLCWAACISSIAAYKTNTAPATPVSLYNIFYYIPGYSIPSEYSKPVGIPYFETLLFQYHYGLNYSSYNRGMTFGEVYSSLQAGNPVYAAIFTSTDTNTVGHGVVICGTYLDPNTGVFYYRLMDPNYDQSYVTIGLNDTHSTSFVYRTSWYLFSPVFTYWDRNFH